MSGKKKFVWVPFFGVMVDPEAFNDLNLTVIKKWSGLVLEGTLWVSSPAGGYTHHSAKQKMDEVDAELTIRTIVKVLAKAGINITHPYQ